VCAVVGILYCSLYLTYGKLLWIRGTGAATYYTSFCGKGIDKGGVVNKLNLQKICFQQTYLRYGLIRLKWADKLSTGIFFDYFTNF
jgi:hypothetical protein